MALNEFVVAVAFLVHISKISIHAQTTAFFRTNQPYTEYASASGAAPAEINVAYPINICGKVGSHSVAEYGLYQCGTGGSSGKRMSGPCLFGTDLATAACDSCASTRLVVPSGDGEDCDVVDIANTIADTYMEINFYCSTTSDEPTPLQCPSDAGTYSYSGFAALATGVCVQQANGDYHMATCDSVGGAIGVYSDAACGAYTGSYIAYTQGCEKYATPEPSNPNACRYFRTIIACYVNGVNILQATPTKAPTDMPSISPTDVPTLSPTVIPTMSPTDVPTMSPTLSPTDLPTETPSDSPTLEPTLNPTLSPTVAPSESPTLEPTLQPTRSPLPIGQTHAPTPNPTNMPTQTPTQSPTSVPSTSPTTATPTKQPTLVPTNVPTQVPTTATPTKQPTRTPTGTPTASPTNVPTLAPTTAEPSVNPTKGPTQAPTTAGPTAMPTTGVPTETPTGSPTMEPTLTTETPTSVPTLGPTTAPTTGPTPEREVTLPGSSTGAIFGDLQNVLFIYAIFGALFVFYIFICLYIWCNERRKRRGLIDGFQNGDDQGARLEYLRQKNLKKALGNGRQRPPRHEVDQQSVDAEVQMQYPSPLNEQLMNEGN